MEQQSTVFVVDDEPAIGDSLRFLLASAGFDVKVFHSAEEFLNSCDSKMRGCLLLDLKMPRLGGLELQQVLNERAIRIPIIFLTAHADVPVAVNAMKSGAVDFIEKPFDDHDLIQRIHAALNATIEFDSSNLNSAAVAARIATLTDRERQIMQLLIAGKWIKAIAAELGTSPNTVRNQRTQIFKKMQADSVADLVRMVMSAQIDRVESDN